MLENYVDSLSKKIDEARRRLWHYLVIFNNDDDCHSGSSFGCVSRSGLPKASKVRGQVLIRGVCSQGPS